ncbi:MAG: DUF4157 domain-containing protein, partial [Leptospirales bacterium]
VVPEEEEKQGQAKLQQVEEDNEKQIQKSPDSDYPSLSAREKDLQRRGLIPPKMSGGSGLQSGVNQVYRQKLRNQRTPPANNFKGELFSEPVQRKGSGSSAPPAFDSLQRKAAPEEEEAQAKYLQKKSTGPVPASSNIESSINAARGGGRSLSSGERSYYEPRFGRSFGGVKIHTDSKAAQLSRSVNARAFTVGSEVFFGAGEYSPETTKGKKLMAHELTHTVQQVGHQRDMGKLYLHGENTIQKEQGEKKIETITIIFNTNEHKSIYSIAKKYKTTVKEIYKLNPGIKFKGNIPIVKDGDKIVVPVDGKNIEQESKDKSDNDKKLEAENRDVKKKGPPDFVLTFDDGPHVSPLGKGKNRTEMVLNTLKTNGIKAGFFIQTGVSFRGGAKTGKLLVKRMHEEGHTVGVHTGGTKDHELHTESKNAGRLKQELSDAKKYIKGHTGETPKYVRPPEGKSNKSVENIYKSLKLKNILWDVEGDRGAPGMEGMKQLFKKRFLSMIYDKSYKYKLGYPNIVILYHDIREATSKSLGALIEYMKVQSRKVFNKNPGFKAPP